MKNASNQLIILMLAAAAFLAGCATNLPKGRPSMEYAEVITFMQSETNTKGPNAYSRLEYLRSEDDYHVLQGSVSPAPIKFTPIGIDRYIFRVSDSGELPNFERLSRVYGENSAFIRDFWGPDWQERQRRANQSIEEQPIQPPRD
jgi:ABC-type Fe3+-hydroxamate transport system substrate-binding protein